MLDEIVETIFNLTKEDLVCGVVVFKYLEQEIRSKEKPDYRKGIYLFCLSPKNIEICRISDFYFKIRKYFLTELFETLNQLSV